MNELSREQVEEQCRNIVYASNGDEGTHAAANQLQYTDASLRHALAQQAQEVERLKAALGRMVANRNDARTERNTAVIGNNILRDKLAAMTAERDEIASRWKHEFELRCKVEEELESHAWSISPAMAQAKIDELNAKLTASEQQVARMREALQVLYDEQNDAPLENRRQQWQAAMTLASGALRETGA